MSFFEQNQCFNVVEAAERGDLSREEALLWLYTVVGARATKLGD